MNHLDFSPSSLVAEPLSNGSGYFLSVSYHIIPVKIYGATDYQLIIVAINRNAINCESVTLGEFKTARQATAAAKSHWQELEERINSALPGETVEIPKPHWATVPKTTIVSSAEIRRELDEARKQFVDLGGES